MVRMNVVPLPDEVLTGVGGRVLEWSVNSKGAIVAKGAPANVIGEVGLSPGLALDPDGSAAMVALVGLDNYT
jgi:hypothetical protein